MKTKNFMAEAGGFTLVELLIVIALIAILSVAVLATINPIEQANKAKDASVQNDAAEVMNAYERYYANSQQYPWMAYGPAAGKPTVETAMLLRSDTEGFGICDQGTAAKTEVSTTQSTACDTASTNPGLLISKSELKLAFVGKDAFEPVRNGAHVENGLWLYKSAGSGGSVYVCYVPKAKSNRDSTTNSLWCISNGAGGPTRIKADGTTCIVPTATNATSWGDPTTAITAGNVAIFKCVP